MTMTIDEVMVEEMAKSIDFMDEDEMKNWSYEDAESWVHDQHLYEQQHNITPLPYDVWDVYDTIKAIIETLEVDF